MRVEVVSPERITFSGEADMVVVRTVGGGDIAFQPGHIPFIGVLAIREAKIVGGEGDQRFAVHRGFVQTAGDKVTLLTDVSERSDSIDVERAQAAKARAEAALAADDQDEDAADALQRAETRLRVAGVTSEPAH